MSVIIYVNCFGRGAWVIAELIATLTDGGGKITIVVGGGIVFKNQYNKQYIQG